MRLGGTYNLTKVSLTHSAKIPCNEFSTNSEDLIIACDLYQKHKLPHLYKMGSHNFFQGIECKRPYLGYRHYCMF